jgi:hypothetical protein
VEGVIYYVAMIYAGWEEIVPPNPLSIKLVSIIYDYCPPTTLSSKISV